MRFSKTSTVGWQHFSDESSFNMNTGFTHVHHAAVDISELLEAEQPRALCRIIEDEALS